MITRRLSRLQGTLAKRGLDALLVTTPVNTYYLSGFRAVSYSRPVIVIVWEEPVLIVPRLEMEHASSQSRIDSIQCYRDDSMGQMESSSPLHLAIDGAIEALTSMGFHGRLGFESGGLSYAGYQYLADRIDLALVPEPALVERMRMVKDADEITLIRRLSRIARAGMKYQMSLTRPGAVEIDIQAEGNRFMIHEGARLFPDMQIDAISRPITGERTALPHALCKGRKVEAGDVVIHGVGVQGNGYWTGLERCCFVGEPTARQQELFDVMLEAQDAALEAIRPGLPCSQVHEASKRVVEKAGLVEGFLHRTGHSIGLDIHEAPNFSASDDTPMTPGMVLSVEPGLYFDDIGGFRHADNIVITEDGFEFIRESRRDIDAMSLRVS